MFIGAMYEFYRQIILPMIGLVIIAIKIILKNGIDMNRELLGVNFQGMETFHGQ